MPRGQVSNGSTRARREAGCASFSIARVAEASSSSSGGKHPRAMDWTFGATFLAPVLLRGNRREGGDESSSTRESHAGNSASAYGSERENAREMPLHDLVSHPLAESRSLRPHQERRQRAAERRVGQGGGDSGSEAEEERAGGEGGGGSGSGPEEESACRICSDDLTTEEFVNGEAIRLRCHCKGALACVHRECALRWFQHRRLSTGATVCEVCNADTGLEIGDAPPSERLQRRSWRGRRARRARRERRGREADEGGEGEGGDVVNSQTQGGVSSEGDDLSADGDEDEDEGGGMLGCALGCWKFWTSPIFPPTTVAYMYDPESGRHYNTVRTSMTPIDIVPLFVGIYLSQYCILKTSSPVISGQLAASLGYMSAGAFMIGIVQMLVVLNVTGAGHLSQSIMMWAWAGLVSVSSYFIMDHFIDTMEDSEAYKAVLLGSVCTCVIAAASPTFFLTMVHVLAIT